MVELAKKLPGNTCIDISVSVFLWSGRIVCIILRGGGIARKKIPEDCEGQYKIKSCGVGVVENFTVNNAYMYKILGLIIMFSNSNNCIFHVADAES